MKLLLVNLSDTELQKSDFVDDFISDLVFHMDTAREQLDLYEYDCIVVHTPSADTFVWLDHFIHQNRSEGLIFMGTEAPVSDKLRAFEAGVDDYIALPMHMSELVARIKSVIRRKRYQTPAKLYVGNLVIDVFRRQIQVWDKTLKLTKTEYDIFLYLNAHRKRIVAKETLAEYLWGAKSGELDSFNILFAHIKNLRRKLLMAKSGVEVNNIYKIGYQIIET